MSKLLQVFAKAKNTVFLSTCLYVHVTAFMYYLYRGAVSLSVINFLSSLIYVAMLSWKRNSDRSIVIAHFEIIIFSIVCELLSVGTLGFIYYPMGMVAVIFYLISVDKAKKLVLQLVAIVATLVVFYIDINDITILSKLRVEVGDYRNIIIFANLLIMLINMVYVSFLYMAEQERNKAVLEYNMNHDQLTGLYNRRFFYAGIDAAKMSFEKYAIAMLDLDNFKKVNDNYGHESGDAVLVALSGILAETIENSDIAVRWGGEEFVLFMPGDDLDTAYQKLETIVAKVRALEVKTDSHTISFTVTIGLSAGTDLNDYEKVINDADQKLYYGKNHGKDCIILDGNLTSSLP